MTDEAAEKLAVAMNRLAAAIESLKGGALGPGINIYHHNAPQPAVPAFPGYPHPLTPYATSGGH